MDRRLCRNAIIETISPVFQLSLPVRFPRLVSTLAYALLIASAVSPARSHAQQVSPAQAVAAMVKNEVASRNQQDNFVFMAYERSSRTGGHLWTEKVVEINGGKLRRLLDIDSQPLSPSAAAAEDRRLNRLAANPAAFARANQDHKDDEAKAIQLLSVLPKAFLFQANGEQDGCARVNFRPDPAYRPQSLEERAVHDMAGTILIQEPQMRLCRIDAHLIHTVEFGFGLLGRLSQGGGFSMTRTEVAPGDWKTATISIHIDGSLLFFKSFSRQQETVRRDIRLLPKDLTLSQAVALTRP